MTIQQTLYDIIHSVPEYQYIYQSHHHLNTHVHNVFIRRKSKKETIPILSYIGFVINDKYWNICDSFQTSMVCHTSGVLDAYDFFPNKPLVNKIIDMNSLLFKEFSRKIKKKYPNAYASEVFPLVITFSRLNSSFIVGSKMIFDRFPKIMESIHIVIDDIYALDIIQKNDKTSFIIRPFKSKVDLDLS